SKPALIRQHLSCYELRETFTNSLAGTSNTTCQTLNWPGRSPCMSPVSRHVQQLTLPITARCSTSSSIRYGRYQLNFDFRYDNEDEAEDASGIRSPDNDDDDYSSDGYDTVCDGEGDNDDDDETESGGAEDREEEDAASSTTGTSLKGALDRAIGTLRRRRLSMDQLDSGQPVGAISTGSTMCSTTSAVNSCTSNRPATSDNLSKRFRLRRRRAAAAKQRRGKRAADGGDKGGRRACGELRTGDRSSGGQQLTTAEEDVIRSAAECLPATPAGRPVPGVRPTSDQSSLSSKELLNRLYNLETLLLYLQAHPDAPVSAALSSISSADSSEFWPAFTLPPPFGQAARLLAAATASHDRSWEASRRRLPSKFGANPQWASTSVRCPIAELRAARPANEWLRDFLRPRAGESRATSGRAEPLVSESAWAARLAMTNGAPSNALQTCFTRDGLRGQCWAGSGRAWTAALIA
uniref:VPS13 domain-containing protein n=1 Tax=Macrostomum lignano TaxID=282301 RepID=A0A1I8F8M3_9PLAT